MIKNKILLGLIFIIMISTCVFANTYAPTGPAVNEVVSASSLQVNVGSEFYLIFNLSNISFSKFKVDIVNTASLPMDEVTSEVVSLYTNNVATTFTVDKSVISLDKLGVVFTAPNEQSKIKFEVTITSLDTNVEGLKEEEQVMQTELDVLKNSLVVLENELGTLVSGTEEYNKKESEKTSVEGLIKTKENDISKLEKKILNFEPETIKTEIIVDIISKDNNKEKEEFSKEEFEKEFEKEMNKNKKEMNEMSEKMQNMQMNLDDAKSTISSLTKNVTYQGSQNNYLKALSVKGYEFDSSFKKTKDTYFITVDKSVEKVTVNATAEDSTAIVTIYGNTNIQEGKNKVLITVTADDGSTRTYKIYITK